MRKIERYKQDSDTNVVIIKNDGTITYLIYGDTLSRYYVIGYINNCVRFSINKKDKDKLSELIYMLYKYFNIDDVGLIIFLNLIYHEK